MDPLLIFVMFLLFLSVVAVIGIIIYKSTQKSTKKTLGKEGETCTLDDECDTTLKCVSGKCSTPVIMKKKGESCESNYQCEGVLVCDSKKTCNTYVPPPPSVTPPVTPVTPPVVTPPMPPQEEWKFQTSLDEPVCFLNQGTCPTGTEDKGLGGFILPKKYELYNPFTVRGNLTLPAMSGDAKLQSPRICCTNNINFTNDQAGSLFGLCDKNDSAEVIPFELLVDKEVSGQARTAFHLMNRNVGYPYLINGLKIDDPAIIGADIKYNDNWRYVGPRWCRLGQNRKTACGLADKVCPSMYKDMGQAGILKKTDDDKQFGFDSSLPNVTSGDETWKWTHPRLCCPDPDKFNKKIQLAPAIPGCSYSDPLYAYTPGEDATTYNKNMDTYTQCKINANIEKTKKGLTKDTCGETNLECKRKYLSDIELATCGNPTPKDYYNDCISKIDKFALDFLCQNSSDQLKCKQSYRK